MTEYADSSMVEYAFINTSSDKERDLPYTCAGVEHV